MTDYPTLHLDIH